VSSSPLAPSPRRAGTTCDDCFFRQRGLCALDVEAPCPTFREATPQGLVPPRQLMLLERQAAAGTGGLRDLHVAA
jgi:hypothetical protein